MLRSENKGGGSLLPETVVQEAVRRLNNNFCVLYDLTGFYCILVIVLKYTNAVWKVGFIPDMTPMSELFV
jgi:hypothetical protein